jgi:hypothetical protein
LIVLKVPQFVIDRANTKKGLFTADEVLDWPAGLFNRLKSADIVRPAENARSVTCDACGDDHVELVEVVQSPPGSTPRYYIPCPTEGRVAVPAVRLDQWVVIREKLLELGVIPAASATAGRTDASARKPRQGGKVPVRSWTQTDLDAAIRNYKSQRSSTYGDLVDAIKRDKPGAQKSAQRVYGRNVLARELGVKSRAMITKSPEWQAIADELRLPRGKRKARPKVGKKIGHDIAVEQQAVDVGVPIVDQVVRNETIRLIRKSMSNTEAEATVEKLVRGDMTDEQARELIGEVADQTDDQRSRRVRSSV